MNSLQKYLNSFFGVVLLIALGIYSSFYTVQPDEEAVVVRFGKYIGTYPPGLHFKLPFKSTFKNKPFEITFEKLFRVIVRRCNFRCFFWIYMFSIIPLVFTPVCVGGSPCLDLRVGGFCCHFFYIEGRSGSYFACTKL